MMNVIVMLVYCAWCEEYTEHQLHDASTTTYLTCQRCGAPTT